ncbi:hypothetical protein FDP41_001588 [Naegleria fowleri]|uniref:RING-Gid-type domain-containing protein n=1 Tax=Naegleria fowleri TaxID=5763 RepID=A0A6A5C136_NAEFO|nr:uncharacterized protein FDP41_001588 [Naegleria fowleri]KAF0979245.1 hypothetical protein FDP41_001588 [Naegleria fowleri]
MDLSSCSELNENFERASKKQKTTINFLTSEIDNLIEQVESCKRQIENEGKSITDLGKDVMNQIKNTHTKFQQAHKELHSQFSKFGKTIDRCFPNNEEKLLNEKVKISENIVNQIIGEHLFREGLVDVGAIFEKEAGIRLPEECKQQFIELHAICESLKRRDVEPALNWCNEHIARAKQHDAVDEKELDDLRMLAFQLHKLNFVQLLIQNDSKKAIQYARDNLQPFADKNISEIRFLMGSILYSGRERLIKSERYSCLMDVSQWDNVLKMFKKLGCRRINKPMESPLYVAVNAGYQAIPTLLKLVTVTQNIDIGSSSDQLAVEIDLDDEFQYHSIFSCPISKEPATKDNPPMLLPCNHVLLESSLKKLARNTKFKCPYCPTTGSLSDCKPINL